MIEINGEKAEKLKKLIEYHFSDDVIKNRTRCLVQLKIHYSVNF